MSAPNLFLSGVIEGFYGRPWPWRIRLAYADYLQQLGLNTYLYCPKEDSRLRKRWREDWAQAEWAELQALSRAYRERGLVWGIGLSPFALYRDYGAAERRALRAKVERLQELRPALLAILFDDMPGEQPDLAGRQAEIVADVCHWAPQVQVLVCPTYYSYDPVLPRYFGAMPGDYWRQLGRELPARVAVFWTGNRVCSETVAAADIAAIYAELQRPLVLWDNYPVNDGAVRSRFLYLQPLAGRERAAPGQLAGHLCNSMNQGLLSLPALAGLAALYGRDPADDRWLESALGAATWRQLGQHSSEFREAGLDGMGPQRCAELAACYAGLPGPAASEVAGWLRGEYTFDPACLTD